MPVDSKHPEYKAHKKDWELVRAIVASKAQSYIRDVDRNDPLRCAVYRDSAILTNYTAITLEGLAGILFRKKSTLELPPEIAYLQNDATGTELTIDQFQEAIAREIMITGRTAVLVEFQGDQDNLGIGYGEEFAPRARFIQYKAEEITNIALKSVGSKKIVEKVVLFEPTLQLTEDGFSWEEVDKYTVLGLDEQGYYYQDVYIEDLEVPAEPRVYPTNFNGDLLREIPIVFFGAKENDTRIDKAPLLDIAIQNLGHYRNSADYEESCFVMGQPTLVISTESSTEEFKEANPSGLKFGVRTGYNLGPGGSATLLQANANQMVAEAMRQKEKQIAALGARIIAEPGGRETAEAAKLRFASQTSSLFTIAMNIEKGMLKLFKIAMLFESNREADIIYDINKSFYDEDTDPNLLAQLMILHRNKVISVDDIREYLRRTNFLRANRTDEEIDEDIQDQVDLIEPIPMQSINGINNGFSRSNDETQDLPE